MDPIEKRNDDYREISEKIKMMDERLRRMTEELAASYPGIIKEATTQGNK